MPDKVPIAPQTSTFDFTNTRDGGALPPLPGVDFPAGYTRHEQVGRGGMGVVFRAHDRELDRDVAVKLLRDDIATDSPLAVHFLEEARITAQLQHPNIPPVHAVGRLPNGRPFLVMKLIKKPGGTFADLLDNSTGTAEERDRFVTIFEGVVQAVAYAHEHNVVHRDLTPRNVMVGKFGEVQVMDWGLAKVLTAEAPGAVVPSAAAPDSYTVIH
ncbi:MAG: serine/threonine protein kinase [Planctomycetes bacterium]|nr:serine/threonine protein kinase [Planctomycetota bacterium]